jgi:thioredoxin reductase (NADPH)
MTTRAISPRSRIVPSDVDVDVDVDVDRVHDVSVVGSGPAGYTAAIYTARSGFDTLIIEGATPGGALATAGYVENYPGFVRPVCGPSLARAMREQAQRFGAEFQAGEAKGFMRYASA